MQERNWIVNNAPDRLYVMQTRNPQLTKMRDFLLASKDTTGGTEWVYIRSDLCNLEETVASSLLNETRLLFTEFMRRVNSKKRYINMSEDIRDLLERIILASG
ncbi:hypothetical protein M0R04_09410 [Candidatus Dojkabacteria bacterium]|nr:hypothetical protein [Candidatus Dojkabacteria bacterium]